MADIETEPSDRQEPEFQKGEILVVKRENCLDGNTGLEELDGIAMAGFLREFAGDSNILGFALSLMRVGGGIYTTVFVRDLSDKDAMKATLQTTERSFQHLNAVAQQRAGYHSYVDVGDKSPQEFAEWFTEEFHKPPKYSEDSGEAVLNFFELVGSTQELRLLGIVMFE